ncbi:MAG: gliding motility-associated C-terminal domain-containing protein [Spirochaetota bacterium]
MQDELTIPISVGEIGGNHVIRSYQLEIRNAAGAVVWSEMRVDESADPGFFGALLQNLGLATRETTVEIPESTAWDGTYRNSDEGDDGEPVPDGEYTYVLTVTDSREITATSEARTVVVDNTVPEASASVNHTIFSPNGDGDRDTITLTQETSSEDEWVGELTRDGTVAYDVRWTGEAAERFVWGGENPAGEIVEDGEYTYTLRSTDRAGNTGSIDPIRVVVDTAARPLEISASTDAFSPNGDGIQDTVELTFGNPTTELLESAVVTVRDQEGNEVGSVQVDEAIAGSVTFTGYLDQARTELAPEGTYDVSVRAEYRNGSVSEAGPIEITLDVTPPSGSISVSSNIFSPDDGDDYKNSIEVYHDLSSDAEWVGHVYVSQREVVERFELGSDVPPVVTWDGTGPDGDPVPNGPYRYTAIGRDEAGNEYETDPVEVTIDRRPTTIDLLVNREYFSPNGDGEGDVVVVSPQLSVREGISEYSFRIVDDEGNTVLSGSGQGSIPRQIPWDGRGADGEVLPEGEYFGVVDLVYRKGNRPQGVTPIITIDFTVPEVALRASPNRFMPEAEDGADVVRFIPFVDPVQEIVRFEGTVEALNGNEVARITGERPIGTAFWDGTTTTGATAPDGSYVGILEVEHRNGTIRTAQSGRIALGTVDYTAPPDVVLRMSPQPFSPDGDGRADVLSVTLAIADDRPISEWSITVREPDGDVFFEYAAEGDPIRSFEWDGRNDAGDRVTMATDYEVEYEVVDVAGNVATGSETLTIDILTVERYGMRKIDLPDILFEGYTTRYLNWNKELSEQNVRVLDQIAAALRKFPEYDVELHGHAVSVLYYDPELSDIEHEETLLPLSRGRAETIEEALASRGVDEDRFSLEWWGKLRSLVPFSNLDERYINRRVEFYIVR